MDHAIELRTTQSHRIIECACRESRAVRIAMKGRQDSDYLDGSLQAMADGQITIGISRNIEENINALLNRYCEVTLVLDDGRYFFDSHIVGVRPNEEGCDLLIAVPHTVAVNQRRTQPRKAMAMSSTVQLSRSCNGRLHTCQGQLFNLSSTGLALRVESVDADDVTVNSQWSVCFDLPGQNHMYKMDAIVIRKTPANGQAMIVGIRFETDNEEAEIERLNDFLCGRDMPAVRA